MSSGSSSSDADLGALVAVAVAVSSAPVVPVRDMAPRDPVSPGWSGISVGEASVANGAAVCILAVADAA